ncbi:hypothetical protein ACHAWX_005334 [Stephanocyclus meneghinianus]
MKVTVNLNKIHFTVNFFAMLYVTAVLIIVHMKVECRKWSAPYKHGEASIISESTGLS